MESLIGNTALVYIISFTTSVVLVTIMSFLLFRNELKTIPIRLVFVLLIWMAVSVYLCLIVEDVIARYISSYTVLYFLWAALEEILKFIPIYLIIRRGGYLVRSEIINYSIVAAIGFAVFENALFTLKTLATGDIYESILLACQRIIGATLIHIICSAVIISCVALAMKNSKKIMLISSSGLILGIIIHAVFNLSVEYFGHNSILITFLISWSFFTVHIFLIEKVVSELDQISYRWTSVFIKIGGTILLVVLCASIMNIAQQSIPRYLKSDMEYWTNELAFFESNNISWKKLTNLEHDAEVKQIIIMHNSIINNIKSTLYVMSSNGDLPKEQSELYRQHELDAEKLKVMIDKVNED